MRSLFLWHGGRRAVLGELALLLVAGGASLAVRPDHWVGSFKVALDWGTGSLALIAPVSAGFAALVYARMTTRGWDSMSTGLPRGPITWLAPLAGTWLLGLAAMLVTSAVAMATALALGAAVAPRMLWAVPLVSVTLAALVAIGAVIGTSLPRAMAPPVAAVVTFLLVSLSHGGGLPGVFRTGGVTGDLAGETYDYDVLLLQAAVCASLALTCLLALGGHVVTLRRSVTAATVVLGLASTVPAWWVLERDGHERYVAEAHPDFACRGTAPQVCLSADTVRPLAALAEELHRQAAPLVEVGAAVPTRFVQRLPGSHEDGAGVIVFVDEEAMSASASGSGVALALATPRSCPAYSAATAPVRALRVRTLVADWIMTRNGVPGVFSTRSSPAGRWLALPVGEQATWLVESYAALAECRLDDLRLPFVP